MTTRDPRAMSEAELLAELEALPKFRCPFCGVRTAPRRRWRVQPLAQAAAVFLLLCFAWLPGAGLFFWVPLLAVESCHVCQGCGIRLD